MNNSMLCCLSYTIYSVGDKKIVERIVDEITILKYEKPDNEGNVKGKKSDTSAFCAGRRRDNHNSIIGLTRLSEFDILLLQMTFQQTLASSFWVDIGTPLQFNCYYDRVLKCRQLQGITS